MAIKDWTTNAKIAMYLVIAISMVIGVIILGFLLYNYLPESIKSVGQTATTTPINPPSALETTFNILLGASETQWTWEELILKLVIFFILFFALSDIISMFSTFSEATSWVIGFGLAVVAGVTKFIPWIVNIMGFTAGLGAVGIALIVGGAIFAAVTLNLGITPLFKWRMTRQNEIEAMKSEKGTSKVTSAIKGLKKIEKELGNP